MTVEIRPARPEDDANVAALVTRAFGRSAEARLVAAIRARGEDALALVAVEGGRVVGHVLASPITIVPAVPGTFLGVAPLSVEPDRQGAGIGTRLMRAVVDSARRQGVSALFLLGDPRYYARFGFRQSAVGNDYGATSSFMSLELAPGCLAGVGGVARYVAAFAETET